MKKVLEVLFPYAEADPESTAEAGHVLGRLADGKPLDSREYWSKKKRAEQQWDWVPALPRSLSPGDMVRVKRDAYQGDLSVHNGKVGTVVALRRGVIVQYENHGAGMGFLHDVSRLERRVLLRARGRTQ